MKTIDIVEKFINEPNHEILCLTSDWNGTYIPHVMITKSEGDPLRFKYVYGKEYVRSYKTSKVLDNLTPQQLKSQIGYLKKRFWEY